MIYATHDALLRQFLAERIKESKLTLDEIQKRTQIHRSKLGRIRLGKAHVTTDDASCILRALGRPARADMLLLALGVHDRTLSESSAFLEEFLANLPAFVERLTALGSLLNPLWARGSIQHLAEAIEQQVARIQKADTLS